MTVGASQNSAPAGGGLVECATRPGGVVSFAVRLVAVSEVRDYLLAATDEAAVLRRCVQAPADFDFAAELTPESCGKLFAAAHELNFERALAIGEKQMARVRWVEAAVAKMLTEVVSGLGQKS